MEEKKSTVVYFCDILNGNTDVINIPEVMAYAEKLSGVSMVWLPNDVSLSDLEQVAKNVKKNNLVRVVIAGNNPGMHKSFFSKVLVLSGNNPEDVFLASFTEHGAFYKADTDRAKAIVACAVHNIPFESAAVPD